MRVGTVRLKREPELWPSEETELEKVPPAVFFWASASVRAEWRQSLLRLDQRRAEPRPRFWRRRRCPK